MPISGLAGNAGRLRGRNDRARYTQFLQERHMPGKRGWGFAGSQVLNLLRAATSPLLASEPDVFAGDLETSEDHAVNLVLCAKAIVYQILNCAVFAERRGKEF